MDFLNNTFAQVRDLFLSMTPGARIVAGLLLAVVVVSVGFLFQQGTAGQDEYLFGGEYLSSSELNKVEAAIAARKLSGHHRDGNRIRVPAAQKHEYWAAVAEGGALPRSFHDLLEKSLDSGSVLESRETRRQRLQVSMAQTLSEIVRKMYWVEDAVVLYDQQQSSGFNRPRQVTGSVSVQPLVGEALTPERKKILQDLVAHSVAGLKADDVIVTSLGDDVAYSGDGMSPEVFDNDYLRARAMFNRYQRDDIRNLLSFIPGVKVEVMAELDNISEDVMRTIKPDEKTAQLREVSSLDSTERTVADPSGPPGLDSQGPYREGAQLANQQNSDKTKSQTKDNQFFAGYADQQIRKAGYLPTTVHATVAIPRNYVAGIWKQRNGQAQQPEREPEKADLQPIEDEVRTYVENLVNNLLPGHLEGEDKYKYVMVEFVDSIAPPPIDPPTLASTALSWTSQNWGTLTMAGLAMFSLIMLRSIVTSPPPERSAPPTLALETTKVEGNDSTDAGDEEAEKPVRLRLKKGTTLKDDLVEMVREDPNAAATILRNWISNAA